MNSELLILDNESSRTSTWRKLFAGSSANHRLPQLQDAPHIYIRPLPINRQSLDHD